MHNKINKNHGFTLVELLIVITIIGLMLISVKFVNFTEINNRKRAEVFTSHVARSFETVRNNSLFGKSVSGNNPEAWRVIIDRTSSGTIKTEYSLLGVWNDYDDTDFSYIVDFPKAITSISCDDTDESSGSGIVIFEGGEVSLSGSCASSNKFLTLGTSYSSHTGQVIINAVSGVIETKTRSAD